MKRLILPCLCWTMLTLLAGMIGVWQIHTHPIAGVPAELRGQIGNGDRSTHRHRLRRDLAGHELVRQEEIAKREIAATLSSPKHQS